MKCSRHAGPVASHCRFAPMFASARPPCRHPLAVFLRARFCGSMYEPSQQRNMAEAINITSGRIGGGVFFERKRRKKSHRMVGQSVSSNCRNANQAGWFGQSVTSKYRCVHAMPVRSPLTAASRQCSRRPARHVVIRSEIYSDCISESRY